MTTAIGCSLFVLLGMAMVIVGLPERSSWQTWLLSLSGFAFAGAVAFGLWRMPAFHRLRANPTKNFTLSMRIGAGFLAVGALTLLLSFFGMPMLIHLAQFFVWFGLLIVFVYVASFDTRHRDRTDASLTSVEIMLTDQPDTELAPTTPRRAL